jgi:diguanylate cyclase (GGDEF)-like protein/PAS domain S-box-containing protein
LLAIYYCVRDLHDLRLVLVAGLICMACTVAAVMLLRQAQNTAARESRRWLATAGIATGFGVWATHFVAMLGYDPGVVIGYDVTLTLASLVIAIVTTTSGFMLALKERGLVGAMVGGALVGTGIVAMHYTGMSAVEFPGEFIWSSAYIALSVAGAIAPSILALRLAIARQSVGTGIAASGALALAILLLHFTAMTAITVMPSTEPNPHGLLFTPFTMGIAIGVASLTTLILCIGAALFGGRANAVIRARGREFEILVQGISDCALYMLDKNGRVASWNAGAERLTGYAADEIIGQPLYRFYTEEDVAAGKPALALKTAAERGTLHTESWRVRKDASRFWAHVSVEAVRDQKGAFLGFAEITRDMTRFKEDQERLAQARENLDAALGNMHQGLLAFDADEKLILFNRRVGEIFQVPPDVAPVGTSFRRTLELALEKRAGQSISPEALDEVYNRHMACLTSPEGGTLIVDFTPDCTLSIAHRPAPGGGWVSTFEDITERRRADARIAHMAMHDELTGLPNRANFNQRVERFLDAARRNQSKLAMVVMNLNRFKDINDTHGHAVGDAVLKALARNLAAAIHGSEVVARLNGDEFAACKMFSSDAELTHFLDRLERSVATTVRVGAIAASIDASIGVACYPADGDSRELLFNNANLAMSRAQAIPGRRICAYEPAMDEAARLRRRLGDDLRGARARDEFHLAYQVQKSVASGEITGYEVLLRWKHGRDGWISPAEFIPIAEENGEILNIGVWVLRTACAAAAGWKAPHKIAVNLSPTQLMNIDLIETVRAVLQKTGLAPERLELEITETAIVADKAHALHILRQIKTLGVTIAMDDFGTGYASLDTLHSFPFDKIKIDKSFLLDSQGSMQARAIIRAILSLGQSLAMPVLAEGLETDEQLAWLRQEGCDQAQGYLLGRPHLNTPDPERSQAA